MPCDFVHYYLFIALIKRNVISQVITHLPFFHLLSDMGTLSLLSRLSPFVAWAVGSHHNRKPWH